MPGVLDLMGYVQKQGEMGRQRGQENRLSQLSSQAYSATPEQRTPLLADMARTDPAAARTQQTQFRQLDTDAAADLSRKAGQFVALAEMGDEATIAAAYPVLAQEAQRVLGHPLPPTYDRKYLAGIQKLAGAANGASGVQSTYVDGQGNRVAIMRDGSTQVLGTNDAGMQGQTITVTGADGRPRQMTFNKRTMTYEPAQMGGQAPQPQGQPQPQQAGPQMTQVQYATDDGAPIPANEQAMLQAAMAASARGEDFTINANQQLPPMRQQPSQPQRAPQSGGDPFTGRSPEDQAARTTAAQEQAKINAELGAYTTMTDLEVDRATRKAQAEAGVKLGAEQAALQNTRQTDAGGTLALLAEAEKLIPLSTGSGVGTAADKTAAYFGKTTQGANNIAALQTIAGQLTSKMPRMQGPQSDKDVEMYKQMAGDLANSNVPVARRLAALRTIRALNEKYASPQPAAGGTVWKRVNGKLVRGN